MNIFRTVINITTTICLLLFSAGCNRPEEFRLQALAKSDVEFITKTILENHPGPYNSLDPEFTKTLNLAHQEALDSINKVKTVEDHNEVLQKYAKHFDDSHLNISTAVKLSKAPADFYNVKNYDLKEFMPKVTWITLPTFWPNLQQQNALNKIIELLPNYRNYKLIIFDLRGNTGGNSNWGTKIVRALFGQEYADEKIKIMNRNVYIDWRVSKDNVEHISYDIGRLEKQFGKNSDAVIQQQKLYKSMSEALSKRMPLYTQRNDEIIDAAKNNINLCHTKIIAIIDGQCFSACLDFIDELKSLNHPVILFGQTTAADNLYIETRTVELPSKLGHLNFPIKVYRNRPRKNNEPYHPDVEFVGNIKDTKAVEHWVKDNWQDMGAKPILMI